MVIYVKTCKNMQKHFWRGSWSQSEELVKNPRSPFRLDIQKRGWHHQTLIFNHFSRFGLNSHHEQHQWGGQGAPSIEFRTSGMAPPRSGYSGIIVSWTASVWCTNGTNVFSVQSTGILGAFSGGTRSCRDSCLFVKKDAWDDMRVLKQWLVDLKHQWVHPQESMSCQ